MLAYFKARDAASPRVEVEILGKTTLGEDLFLAAISSDANLANKRRLQEIARRIADPRGLSEAEADALVREGKVFLFITCNIHSTEIGAICLAFRPLAVEYGNQPLEPLIRLNIMLVQSKLAGAGPSGK